MVEAEGSTAVLLTPAPAPSPGAPAGLMVRAEATPSPTRFRKAGPVGAPPKMGALGGEPSAFQACPRSDWIADSARPFCRGCRSDFTVTLRRHHCRVCGEVSCGDCSLIEILDGTGSLICFSCFDTHADAMPAEHPLQPRKIFGRTVGTTAARPEQRAVRLILRDDHTALREKIKDPRTTYDARLTSDGRRAVHLAAQQGSTKALALLVQLKASVGQQTDSGMTPLHFAARRDDPAIIATLIEAGGSMRSRDAEGRTPLHMAAESSAVATAVFIDRVDRDLMATTEAGAQALHHAAAHYDDDDDCVQQLLAAGAEIESQDDAGETAIHYAAAAGNPNIVRFLVAHGASITATNERGETALHKAASAGYSDGGRDGIAALLEAGCSIAATDNLGRSFFDHAMSNGGLAMMAAIEHLNISKPSGLSCEPITRVLRYQVPGSVSALAGVPRLPKCDQRFVQTLKLANAADELVVYRASYQGPGHFRVSPSIGYIEPQSAADLRVVMALPDSRMMNEVRQDRIIVQAIRTAAGGKDLGDCFERMWHRIDESQKLQLVFRVEVTVYDPNAPNRNPSPHR